MINLDDAHMYRELHPALQNRRLILGCFPWKFQGGEAAFARVVAFDGAWPTEV
jgi:hypothetical protein